MTAIVHGVVYVCMGVFLCTWFCFQAYPNTPLLQATTAAALLTSPRLRDADAGASLLMLLFRVYVQQLGWSLRMRPAVCVAEQEAVAEGSGSIHTATVDFLQGLLLWLQVQCSILNTINSAVDTQSTCCCTLLQQDVLLPLLFLYQCTCMHSLSSSSLPHACTHSG